MPVPNYREKFAFCLSPIPVPEGIVIEINLFPPLKNLFGFIKTYLDAGFYTPLDENEC